MNKKIIFELKLNSKDSIIAYEKKNYETCYKDSLLYSYINGKKTKLVESSFCYGFGAEMYYRIHNIHDFSDSSVFAKLLKEDLESLTYNERDYTRKMNAYDSYFFGCSSLNNFDLYLLKQKNKYFLLFVSFAEIESTRKYDVKILKEFSVDENIIAEWKAIIKAEWEKRVVIEGERNQENKQSMEEWEKYFLSMRSD